MLYVRMALTMAVALYTSRVVLKSLGVVDFGIYSLVGSFVVMLDIINSALYGASIRYITYITECGDMEDRKRIFSSIKFAHLIIAVTTLIIGETVGLWFLNTQMNIPADRFYAASCVYQCSLGILFLAIVSLPYTALIMSHERMSTFAYMTILDVLLKLSVAVGIAYVEVDKLIVYAILMLGVQLVMRIAYMFYCNRNFQEANVRVQYIKKDVMQIFGFTSWKIYGCASASFNMQGTNILLNIFFGPIVNASRGIANQIHAALVKFCSNFIVAVKPQIIKSYANEDMTRMHSLVIESSKISIYLTILMVVPLYIFTPHVLKIWLGSYPEYSVPFARIILIQQLIFSLNYCLEAAIEATGHIKKYQLLTGTVSIITLPASYIALRYFDASPVVVMFIYLALELLTYIVRILITMPAISLSIWRYIKAVIIPTILLLTVIACVYALLPKHCPDTNILQLITEVCITILATGVLILLIGFRRQELSEYLKYFGIKRLHY